MAPLVIEFQGSSFPRTFTKPQSIMEKRPPHTAKLPVTQKRFNKLGQCVGLFCHHSKLYLNQNSSGTQQL